MKVPRRKVMGATLFIIGAGFAAFGWTFTEARIEVVREGELPEFHYDAEVPVVRLSRLHTADISSRHGFSVRGASLSEPFTTAISAFLVEHPEGRLLIDAGMAANMEEHFAISTPAIMRAFSDMTPHAGIAALLHEGGLDEASLRAVIPTHAHWDHISGMAELRGTPMWLRPEEVEFAHSGHETMELFQHIDDEETLTIEDLALDGPAFGPFEHTHDVFGDQSVVVVPMAGHTPGSVGVLVTLSGERRFLFIGDTAWASEGVDWPAEKPWVSRRIADHDYAGVRGQLVPRQTIYDPEGYRIGLPCDLTSS